MPTASKTPLTDDFVALLDQRGLNIETDQEADDIVARMKVLELGYGAIKITFDQPVDESDEAQVELGPYNQGVAFEAEEEVLNDVATRTPIATYTNGAWAVLDLPGNEVPLYRRLFIQ